MLSTTLLFGYEPIVITLRWSITYCKSVLFFSYLTFMHWDFLHKLIWISLSLSISLNLKRGCVIYPIGIFSGIGKKKKRVYLSYTWHIKTSQKLKQREVFVLARKTSQWTGLLKPDAPDMSEMIRIWSVLLCSVNDKTGWSEGMWVLQYKDEEDSC